MASSSPELISFTGKIQLHIVFLNPIEILIGSGKVYGKNPTKQTQL
jgi:hypothetical protein